MDFLLERKLRKREVVSIGIYIEYEDEAIELYGYDIIKDYYSPFIRYDMRYVELSPFGGVLRGYFKTYDSRDNKFQPRRVIVESGEEFLISEEKVVFRHPRDYA